jgi:hypothetical protein
MAHTGALHNRAALSCWEAYMLQEYERSSSVARVIARGLQGARRRGRAGRWQTERLSGAALPSNAPGAGRSKAEARAHAPAAGAQTTKNRPLCMATESIFFEPTRNLRRPYDLLCERRSMPRCERFSGSGHTSPPLRPPFPTPLATGVFGCACLDTCVVSTNCLLAYRRALDHRQ